jgi:hypothetical protein
MSKSNPPSLTKLIILLLLVLAALGAVGEFLISKFTDDTHQAKPAVVAAPAPSGVAGVPAPPRNTSADPAAMDRHGGPPWRRHRPDATGAPP